MAGGQLRWSGMAETKPCGSEGHGMCVCDI